MFQYDAIRTRLRSAVHSPKIVRSAAVLLAVAPLWLLRNASISTPTKIVACSSAACLLAVYDDWITVQVTENNVVRRALALVIGLLTSWFLLRESVSGGWWIIDDHEVADALAVGNVDTVGGFFKILANHREIGGPPWDYPRYRPAYYVLRYLECLVWGFNGGHWYLGRLVMLGTALGVSWNALVRFMGAGQTSLAMLYVMTFPFWVDILGRLGPAEYYAAIGVALFLGGAVSVVRRLPDERTQNSAWVLMAIGSVVAYGSKENFVFLPALLLLFLCVAAYFRKLSRGGLAVSIVALLMAVWTTVVVVISVRRHGATVYGEDASLGSAPEYALAGIAMVWDATKSYLVPIAVVMACCVAYYRSEGWPRRVGEAVFAIAFCFAVFALQYIVYKGRLFTGMRYDFPSILIPPAVVIMGFAFLRRELSAVNGLRRLQLGLCAVALVAGTLTVSSVGFKPLKAGISANVARTQRFTSSMEAVATRASAEPQRPIVIVANDALAHYEPVVSVRIFLRQYGLSNPVFLKSDDGRTDIRLAEILRTWSTEGLVDWNTEGMRGARDRQFLPLPRLSSMAPPFAVVLGGAPPAGSTVVPLQY